MHFVSSDGLVPNRQHAITWTSVDCWPILYILVGFWIRQVHIGSGNGLVPNRQHAITWTSVDCWPISFSSCAHLHQGVWIAKKLPCWNPWHSTRFFVTRLLIVISQSKAMLEKSSSLTWILTWISFKEAWIDIHITDSIHYNQDQCCIYVRFI